MMSRAKKINLMSMNAHTNNLNNMQNF